MRQRRSARQRALPLPAVLAALAVAPALAAGGGSVSISPPIVEHPAAVGTVGAVNVGNTSGQTMRITVAAHPWIQAASGATAPNQRATLGGVQPSPSAFTLASGASQSVTLRLLRAPAGGSLYANVDVTAAPSQPSRGRNAVTLVYRLIASLRLNPVHPVFGARVGGVVVTGTHARGSVAVAVRNTGNTLTPIGGSVYIRGPRGAHSGAITPVRILPGATVDVPVLALAGSLPAGSYSMSASLTQGGRHVVGATKRFKVR